MLLNVDGCWVSLFPCSRLSISLPVIYTYLYCLAYLHPFDLPLSNCDFFSPWGSVQLAGRVILVFFGCIQWFLYRVSSVFLFLVSLQNNTIIVLSLVVLHKCVLICIIVLSLVVLHFILFYLGRLILLFRFLLIGTWYFKSVSLFWVDQFIFESTRQIYCVHISVQTVVYSVVVFCTFLFVHFVSIVFRSWI